MEQTTEQRPVERRQRVQSAEMGMSVLKALARLGGSASLTAVAAEIGESTAKVHRYMASLTQEGLVAQDPATQHYYLGREAIQIGLAALRQCDPIRLGEAALVRLREQLEVTCFIAVMGNKGPTILRFEEPGLPVTINVRAGSVLPLLWSATGRAFLGYLDEAHVRRLADEELARANKEQRASLHGRNPIEQLRKEVREQGCAVINDILLRGISAVAAPIFDYTGRVSAVLTALGASGGFDTDPQGRIASMVRHEAADISAALGARAKP
ncbi:MAG TPA: IclR family transcriptional regulator [Noviherbaspirillum sp.]|nr:IclR family transcriptional regulator [Noviherbaspirillum sp.]